jgi:hypothetical protein
MGQVAGIALFKFREGMAEGGLPFLQEHLEWARMHQGFVHGYLARSTTDADSYLVYGLVDSRATLDAMNAELESREVEESMQELIGLLQEPPFLMDYEVVEEYPPR